MLLAELRAPSHRQALDVKRRSVEALEPALGAINPMLVNYDVRRRSRSPRIWRAAAIAPDKAGYKCSCGTEGRDTGITHSRR